MAIRNLLDALFPLYGLPYAQAAAELEMAAAAATVLARFFRRAERESCRVRKARRPCRDRRLCSFSALFSPFFPLLHTSLSHFLFTIFL